VLLAVAGMSVYAAQVTRIGAGDSYTFAITSAGVAKGWGNNGNAQLGDGSTTQRLTPTEVMAVAAPVDIAGGWAHTCAVTGAGGVKCWGNNWYGQVGNNSTNWQVTPADVSGLTSGVTAVAAGMGHSCVVTSGGGVKCWGRNAFGQLGDNSTTGRLTPVDVNGLTSGATAIGAGEEHSCALVNGGVKCWGKNDLGQLGDGSFNNSPIPVAVSGLGSGVVAIAVGGAHGCALTSGGGVKCWGGNGYGQLGDNTTWWKSTPVDVTGLTSGVTAIAAGGGHSCALLGGAAKCWGNNGAGQLGNNATTNSSVPVDVSGLAGAAALALGAAHSCALKTSGVVWCWGDNSSGQLDDNSTVNRPVPAAAWPDARLSLSAASGSEPAQTQVTVTVETSWPVAGAKTLGLEVTGTGITAGDYSLSPAQITLADGAAQGSLTLAVVDDTLVEGTETATIALAAPPSGVALANTGTSATLAIADDDVFADVIYTLSGGKTVTEGHSGAQSLTLTVTRNRTDGPSSVAFAATTTSSGGEDFGALIVTGEGVTLNGSTIQFATGAQTAFIQFDIYGDEIDEDDQRVQFTLNNPTGIAGSGASVAGSPQNLVIADDDAPPVWRVRAVVGGYLEGDQGTFDAVFIVTAVGQSEKGVAVDYTTVNGSAAAGSDFQANSGRLGFLGLSGSGSQEVRVPLVGDTLREGDEGFSLQLSNPENASIQAASASMTIIDDDDGSANQCVADAKFHSTSYFGNYYCNAAQRIRAGTNVVVAPGGKLVYSSPIVHLLPGTGVMRGGYFHAGRALPNPFLAARAGQTEPVRETPGLGAAGDVAMPLPQRLTAAQLPAGLRQWLRRAGVAPEQLGYAVADGAAQWVVFATEAALFSNDANGASDVYAYRAADDRLLLLSQTHTGQAGNGPSDWPVIDGQGRQVLFQSTADDLTAADANGVRDLFRFDTHSGALQNLTADALGASGHPALDTAGQWVLHDRQGEAGRRAVHLLDLAQALSGEPLSAASDDSRHPALSADGRYGLWLEGDGVRFRDHLRGVETWLPAPTELRPFMELARPFFREDGTEVEWVMPGADAPVVMANPWSGG